MAAYDAIVVGAGPAGSVAAWHLARAGCRVLLLEKERLGRDKPCGGGLTPRAYGAHAIPIDNLPMDNLVAARLSGVELRLSGRCLARVGAPETAIWMVQRAAFDQRLAEAAGAAGAELHEAEPAVFALANARSVAAETSRGRYAASALLLATGAESGLRATLGFPAPTRAAVAIELEGPAHAERWPSDVAVLDYGVPGGYAWAFPKGECWNVGIGAIASRVGPELRAWLARFLAHGRVCFLDPHLSPRHAIGRRIPLWDGWRNLARGRVALLGDAAGLADPFFAEGIASALASGRLAATTVLDLLAGRTDDLEAYTGALQAALGRHLQRTLRLARLVYPAPGLWIRALAAVPLCRRLAARVVAEPFDL